MKHTKVILVESFWVENGTMHGLTDLRFLQRAIDGAIQLVRRQFPRRVFQGATCSAVLCLHKALVHEFGAIRILFIQFKRFVQICDSFNIHLN